MSFAENQNTIERLVELRQHHFARIDEAAKVGGQSLEEAWQAAFLALPKDAVTHAKRAQHLQAQGMVEKAKAKALEAYGLAGDNHSVQISSCYILHTLGFKEDAFRRLPPIAESEKTGETFARLQINWDMKNDLGTSEAIDRLIDVADLSATDWRRVVGMAKQVDAARQAIGAYNRLFKKEKATSAELADYIAQHFNSDDHEGARALMNGVPAALRQQVSFLEIQAKLERAVGDHEVALETNLKILSQKPDNNNAWNDISELASQDDLPQLVEKLEEIVHAGMAGERSLRMALARMRERLGRFDDAFEAYRAANELLRKSWQDSGYSYDRKQVEGVRGLLTRPVNRKMIEASAAREADSTPPHPIFIVGMPRSGTSLLERVVAVMDGVSAGGEKKALSGMALPNSQKIWRGQMKNIDTFSADDWQQYAEQYWGGSKPDTLFETDKMPQNYMALGWALNMFPTAPILYIEKSPVAQAWSLYKCLLRQSFVYSVDFSDIAHAIKQSRLYMDYWTQVAPERILRIQYEDLVSDPETISKRVAAFCGLEWSPDCLAPQKLDAPSYTLSVVQVRKPISTKAIDAWKKYEKHLAPLQKALKEQGLLDD